MMAEDLLTCTIQQQQLATHYVIKRGHPQSPLPQKGPSNSISQAIHCLDQARQNALFTGLQFYFSLYHLYWFFMSLVMQTLIFYRINIITMFNVAGCFNLSQRLVKMTLPLVLDSSRRIGNTSRPGSLPLVPQAQSDRKDGVLCPLVKVFVTITVSGSLTELRP